MLGIVNGIKFEDLRGVCAGCRVGNVTAAEHVEWQMTPAHEQAAPEHLPHAKLYLNFLCFYHLQVASALNKTYFVHIIASFRIISYPAGYFVYHLYVVKSD